MPIPILCRFRADSSCHLISSRLISAHVHNISLYSVSSVVNARAGLWQIASEQAVRPGVYARAQHSQRLGQPAPRVRSQVLFFTQCSYTTASAPLLFSLLSSRDGGAARSGSSEGRNGGTRFIRACVNREIEFVASRPDTYEEIRDSRRESCDEWSG